MIEDFAPTKMAEGLLYRWKENKKKVIPCAEPMLKALDQLNDEELDILASSACAYVWLNTRARKEIKALEERKEFEDELERKNILGRV